MVISMNDINDNFKEQLPHNYHRYFYRGVEYEVALENIIMDMLGKLESYERRYGKHTIIRPQAEQLELKDGIVHVFTDGGCVGNPGGVGAWAYIVYYNGIVMGKQSGYEVNTTNNRMELMAIIKAMDSVLVSSRTNTIIYSDSMYCINSITKWMQKWAKQDWCKKKDKNGKFFSPVKNDDLMKTLYELYDSNIIKMQHVKAHSGYIYNEMADEMCSLEIESVIGKPL